MLVEDGEVLVEDGADGRRAPGRHTIIGHLVATQSSFSEGSIFMFYWRTFIYIFLNNAPFTYFETTHDAAGVAGAKHLQANVILFNTNQVIIFNTEFIISNA